jgi:hypothetical protein
MHYKLILGLDFMTQNGVKLDMESGIMTIRDLVSVALVNACEQTVRTDTPVCVPARSELDIPVCVKTCRESSVVMLEPSVRLINSELLGVKCIVQVTKGKAMYRLMNPMEYDISLPIGHTLAVVSEIDVHSIVSLDMEQDNTVDNGEHTPKSPAPSTEPRLDFDLTDSDLTPEQKNKLLEFLHTQRDVFATSLHDLGATNVYHHSIDTGDAPPIRKAFYRASPKVKTEIDRQVNEMLETGIIKESNTDWHSPVILVEKKNGEKRFVIDFRDLNHVTKPMAYPLPRLDDVIDAIGESKAQFLTVCDMYAGYWQIPMHPDTKHKASFITHSGIYTWERLPFGLCNAPASYQMVMSHVLRGLMWKHLICYVDDIIIWSANFDQHLEHLDAVFQRLRKAGMTLKPSKCSFAQPEVTYLGHIFSKHGIRPNPDKTAAIKTFPTPKCQRDVKSFLGVTNFYKRYIKGYVHVVAPLTALLKMDVIWSWEVEHQRAFDSLKHALTSAPILSYPDVSLPYILTCDASSTAIGYILSQKDRDNMEHVVAYGGRSLRDNERNWHITEQECLAVVEGIKQYRVYLANTHFTVITDHKALQWLQTVKPNHTGRLLRWALELQAYDYEVVFRPGKNNPSDPLSRREYDPNTSDGEPVHSVQTIVPNLTIDQPCTEDDGLSSINVGDEIYSRDWCQLTLEYADVTVNESAETRASTHASTHVNAQTNIGQLQRQCPDFKHMFAYLESQEIPDDDKIAKRVVREASQFALLNGVLYHFFQPRTKSDTLDDRFIRQVALPAECRQDALLSFHDSMAAGCHLGMDKTYTALKLKYFWHGMYQATHDYVKSCTVCQVAKTYRREQPAPMHPLPIVPPFDTWHMDILGPLVKTSNGYKYILLVVDSFSGWCESIALRTQDAETIAEALYHQILTRYGAMRCLISDRGTNFMSKLVTAMCDIFQITRHHCSSFHPQTNAYCERRNSTIAQCLRAYCDQKQTNWDTLLSSVMMSFRNSPSTQGSQYSPFYLLHACEMQLPFDTAMIPKDTLGVNAKKYIENVLEKLKVAQTIATENMQLSKDSSKDRHDLRSKEPIFRVGDKVLLKNSYKQKGLSQKLLPKWVGSYFVSEVLDFSTYKLCKSDTGKIMKSPAHANRIKLYHDPRDVRPCPVRAPHEGGLCRRS